MTFAMIIGVYFLISVLFGVYLLAAGVTKGAVEEMSWPAFLLFFLLCLPFVVVWRMAKKLGELLKKRMTK